MEQKTEQQEIEDIISSRKEGFGALFKQVRDEYSLSIDDISRELRLDNKIIIALENEDYKQLPAPAFVCGYIRNYARFLKIQSEPLIDYYKKDCNDNVLSANPKTFKEKRIKNKSGKGKSASFLMPLLALFAGAAFIVAVWQLWPYIEKQFLIDKEQVQEDISPSAVNDNTPDSLLLPELESDSRPSIDKDTTQNGPVNVDNKQPANNEILKEKIIVEEGSLLAEETLLSDVSLLPVEEGSLSVEASLPAEASLSAADSSLVAEGSLSTDGSSPAESTEQTISSAFKTDQLVLKFSGNSWIKIKDADNKNLSSGLKKAGEILYLDGQLPYNLFLGDATVVTVNINGAVFDHSAYINDNKTARFKVK